MVYRCLVLGAWCLVSCGNARLRALCCCRKLSMQSSGEPRGVARLLPKVARALERPDGVGALVSCGNAASFLASCVFAATRAFVPSALCPLWLQETVNACPLAAENCSSARALEREDGSLIDSLKSLSRSGIRGCGSQPSSVVRGIAAVAPSRSRSGNGRSATPPSSPSVVLWPMAYGKGPRAQEQQREEGEIDGAYILECFPILAVCRAWCSLVVALSYVEP